jgi:lipoic acid synthetase
VAVHPPWIKVRVPTPAQLHGMNDMRETLSRFRLETVCQGAQCPNAVECWSARTATFMVLGGVCTRRCRFCDVPTGNPGGEVDDDEPRRLAEAVAELGLQYVVLTSVDRDDLHDGGADAFARAVEHLRAVTSVRGIEVLIPDFSGRQASLERVLDAGADVVGHNLETVRRLTGRLRDPRASYDQSLDVLRRAADRGRDIRVKSGLMVGLGETTDEVLQAMADLRDAGVELLTIGQYLQPSEASVPVARYVLPEEFDALAEQARVVAGPIVRSSYHASDAYPLS